MARSVECPISAQEREDRVEVETKAGLPQGQVKKKNTDAVGIGLEDAVLLGWQGPNSPAKPEEGTLRSAWSWSWCPWQRAGGGQTPSCCAWASPRLCGGVMVAEWQQKRTGRAWQMPLADPGPTGASHGVGVILGNQLNQKF